MPPQNTIVPKEFFHPQKMGTPALCPRVPMHHFLPKDPSLFPAGAEWEDVKIEEIEEDAERPEVHSQTLCKTKGKGKIFSCSFLDFYVKLLLS